MTSAPEPPPPAPPPRWVQLLAAHPVAWAVVLLPTCWAAIAVVDLLLELALDYRSAASRPRFALALATGTFLATWPAARRRIRGSSVTGGSDG